MYSSRARRNSKPHVSPERRHSKDGISVGNKLPRLQRQSTAIDETCMPSSLHCGRRSSQPTLSADQDYSDRKTRRDSLSPDSAHYARRRDSRVSVSITRRALLIFFFFFLDIIYYYNSYYVLTFFLVQYTRFSKMRFPNALDMPPFQNQLLRFSIFVSLFDKSNLFTI